MVINTNIHAQMSANNLMRSQEMLGKSLNRLSSGSKIVRPADDAAGLAVSSRLDAQVQRLNAAKANVGNAVSFTQTQDGYMRNVAKALDRMSELAILSQDVTKSDADRNLYQLEFQQLSAYISNTSTVDFNGVSLFSDQTLQVTIDSEGNSFNMEGVSLNSSVYTDVIAGDISSTVGAVAALTSVKSAITQLATDRAKIGSYQSRLSFTSEQLTISKENLNAASSVIKDVDVAEESTEYARYQILVQSGTAMLSQANSMPQNVLKLLQ